MPETVSLSSTAGTSGTCTSTTRVPGVVGAGLRGAAAPARPHRVHSRIGVGLAGGFYPAPHRYQLYLSEGCPCSLRVSITLDLLGLQESVATTLLELPTKTAETAGAGETTETGETTGASDSFAALRGAYEATWHHYDGPLTVPALCDRWSGRIVSNHTPDILHDLAGLLPCRDDARLPRLHPPALAADIDAFRDRLDRDVTSAARPETRAAALESLDRQLASRTYALGDELTAADVDLWVALTQLDAPDALFPYRHLQDYVRRLGTHPAFRTTVRRRPCRTLPN